MLRLWPGLFIQDFITSAGVRWPMAMFSPAVENRYPAFVMRVPNCTPDGVVWSKKLCAAMSAECPRAARAAANPPVTRDRRPGGGGGGWGGKRPVGGVGASGRPLDRAGPKGPPGWTGHGPAEDIARSRTSAAPNDEVNSELSESLCDL